MVPETKMIFGAVPPRAAMSSARLWTMNTRSGNAADPPVVPAPNAAQPSFTASVSRLSAS
jgi:hypothetical protein